MLMLIKLGNYLAWAKLGWFSFVASAGGVLPSIVNKNQDRNRNRKNKLRFWLMPFIVGLAFLLTGCDYDSGGGTPTPKAPPTLEKVTPTKTDFGPAGFLVEGISNFLNSFTEFLGNIGVGVLKWFIYTTDSLNLTRGGDYRLCQIDKASFNPTTPIDPLASCSIAVYDEIKYLPSALLGVVLVYFLTKYTFQGLFGSRLSLTDFVSNLFLVVIISFNLDFIITLVIDVSSKLFLMILTIGSSSSSGSGTEDITSIGQGLDKLATLFNIAPIHKQDLGIALVLVIICVPAVLALALIGVFFFTRVIFFLLYFLLGVPAVAAKLTDETDFFFTGWYTGLLKLAASSLPLAVVLRLGLEVAKVLEISAEIDPVQYIILMLVITLLFGAGGFYAFLVLRSEVRRGVATASRLGGVVASKLSGGRPNRGSNRNSGSLKGASALSQPAGSAEALPPAGTSRGASARGGATTTSLPPPVTSTNDAGSGSGRSGSRAPAASNLALTSHMLTNAVSTGVSQAFTAQQARNDRIAGAVLNQLTSIRVTLDEMKVSMQQLNRGSGSGNGSYGGGGGYSSGYGYEVAVGEYRELVPEQLAAQTQVRGYLGSGGNSGRPATRRSSPGAYREQTPGQFSGRTRFRTRPVRARLTAPRYYPPASPGPSNASSVHEITTSGGGGIQIAPLTPAFTSSGKAHRSRSAVSYQPANSPDNRPGRSGQPDFHRSPPVAANSNTEKTARRSNRTNAPEPASGVRGRAQLAHSFGDRGGSASTRAKNNNNSSSGPGSSRASYDTGNGSGNGQAPNWQASVQMLVSPNTGLPYTGQQSRTRLKPIRSTSSTQSKS